MKADKELYRGLRVLPRERLWNDEVAQFERSTPGERVKRVAVIRAVGVVFSESGTAEHRAEARSWLVRLLQDPSEKVRRYAMTALPKLGGGQNEERALLSLLRTTTVDREKKFLGQALDKIGGTATLNAVRGRRKDQGSERQKRGECYERQKQRNEGKQEGPAENPQGKEKDEEGEEEQVGWEFERGRSFSAYAEDHA